MMGSLYIQWAKERERYRYNIGGSSIRPCPHALFHGELEDLTVNGPNAWGWPPLLSALASRYAVDAEQVTLAAGASMANHLVCAALIRPGDHVLVEVPGYEPLRALPSYLGADVQELRRRRQAGYALEVEHVERALRAATRLVILSDYHNPSGAPCGEGAWDDLAELAHRHGFHVLVDEVYREFTYRPGDRLAVHRSPQFVSTCSLTKAYGLDGLRAGWILSAPVLAARLRSLNDLFGIIMPHPIERLALRAIDHLDVLREDVEGLLGVNRPLVEAFIDRRAELDWESPIAGPIGFVRCRGASVDALVQTLERAHDATLPPGRFFGDPEAFRIGFGMLTEDLQAGLECLDRALDQLRSVP